MQTSGAGSGATLSAFNGENSAGTWTLLLVDNYPSSDDGILNELCLRFFTNVQAVLPNAIQSLACVPTTDGAVMSWANGSPYASIELTVDGQPLATLAGSATSYTVSGMPAGAPFEVELEGFLATGGAPSCPIACTVFPQGALPPPLTEKLVFVLIDGLRYEDGLGHPTRQHVPAMDALAQQGAIIEPFLNQGATVTSRAIPALLCGSYEQPISFFDPTCGQNNIYSARPTIYEYYRQQLGRPASDCQYILGPYCPWRASFHPSYGPAYWPQWVATSGGDDANWAAAQTVLATDKPTFLTLYLPDVDSAGHSGNFTDYIDAIEHADEIVGDLWAYLQSDPEYAGKTTMIITNDHGRHWYDFAGHGDDCYGCETIELLAVGPGVKPGVVSTIQRGMPDFAPTIGALLGFTTEFADGVVMTEILAECQEDIGFGGPGGASLSVCGGDLTAGTTADVYFTGGPVDGTAIALATLALSPIPLAGGTLIDPTPDFFSVFNTNLAGAAVLTGVPGGIGPVSLFLQTVFFDPALVPLAPHVGFSNAVRIDFQ